MPSLGPVLIQAGLDMTGPLEAPLVGAVGVAFKAEFS